MERVRPFRPGPLIASPGVVFFGDSITRGFSSGDPNATTFNGFREVVDTLVAAQTTFESITYVGTQNMSTASFVRGRLSEGVNGDNCFSKLPGGGATNGSGYTRAPIDTIFGTGMPLHGLARIMVAGLGTNTEDGGVSFNANYLSLFQQIHALEGFDAYVLWTPFTGVDPSARRTAMLTPTTGLHDQLRALGLNVISVDVAVGSIPTTDGVHPTLPGYAQLGALIAEGVVQALRAIAL